MATGCVDRLCRENVRVGGGEVKVVECWWTIVVPVRSCQQQRALRGGRCSAPMVKNHGYE